MNVFIFLLFFVQFSHAMENDPFAQGAPFLNCNCGNDANFFHFNVYCCKCCGYYVIVSSDPDSSDRFNPNLTEHICWYIKQNQQNERNPYQSKHSSLSNSINEPLTNYSNYETNVPSVMPQSHYYGSHPLRPSEDFEIFEEKNETSMNQEEIFFNEEVATVESLKQLNEHLPDKDVCNQPKKKRVSSTHNNELEKKQRKFSVKPTNCLILDSAIAAVLMKKSAQAIGPIENGVFQIYDFAQFLEEIEDLCGRKKKTESRIKSLRLHFQMPNPEDLKSGKFILEIKDEQHREELFKKRLVVVTKKYQDWLKKNQ